MFEDIVKSAGVSVGSTASTEGLMSNDKIRISIIGVGGAGCNTIQRMMKTGVRNATTVAINTDQLQLKSMDAHKKVMIGASITKGLGAGGFPEVAEKCAEASREKLREVIGENELVFLAAGMGGGTGTGAAPVVAQIAKEQGAIVVSIVTVPFALERARLKKAEWGLKRLTQACDTTVVIDNNRLVQYAPNLPIADAFNLADAITGKAVTGITDTITMPSMMNIDFADVRSIMEHGGVAMISLGEGKGQDRVEQAVRSTLDHPLLDVSYEGAKGALLHMEGGSSLTLGDSISIGEKISDTFAQNAEVKMGARLSPDLGDTVTVTAIVTGIKCGHLPWLSGCTQESEDNTILPPSRISMAENLNFI